jgi:hypothetical protein
MDAPVGGEVQGKVSAVATLPSLRVNPQKAGGEDLADLGEPLGGGHQVGVESVVQNRYPRGRDDPEDKRGWLKRAMMPET